MSVSEKNKAQSSKQGYLYLLEKSKFKKLKNFFKFIQLLLLINQGNLSLNTFCI